MNDLSISLLGSFQATLNEDPISQFRTKSVQALLIYLVCEAERPSSREHLMELLWPGMPQTSAQANMRQTLYRLRKVIPEVEGKQGEAVPFLINNRQTIQINPNATYFADVQAFARLVNSDPAEAINLYRGDFLLDFYMPDSETFEQWMIARRADFQRQVLGVMEGVTAVSIQNANYDQAVQLAQRQLEIDNLRESSHRQLMEAWARNGRRQEAVTHYHHLHKLLQDELAIEPEPETIALLEAIRAGELSRAASTLSPYPLLTDNQQPKHNLPQRLSSFIGREKELAAITHLITQHRLVMLTGVGGIGKTNLCLQVGQNLLETFADGIWLVELAPIADPALVSKTAAYALGLRESSEAPSILETLLENLHEKQCLLILDNCEHVIEAAAQFVETVLHACPKVKILASSREALAVPGEVVFQVPSLSIPNDQQLVPFEEWAHYDSVRLFVERATAVLPTFTITPNNFKPIVQICQQLDGIPLALELAAARVQMLTTEQIAIRLNNRFRLLTGGSRTALPRQQTLRALIDWSWELLSDSDQKLLPRLSVFAGGMNLEAVEAICASDDLAADELLDVMTELVNKSLVIAQRKQGQETRYHMLETIRQYAQERLVMSGQSETFRQHHLAYFQQWTEKVEPELVGPDQVAWNGRLEQELDNMRAALSWALGTDSENGLRLFTAVCRFWFSNYIREGEHWLEQLLAVEKTVSPAVKAKALWLTSYFKFALFKFEQAKPLAEEGLALYKKLEDPQGIARILAFENYFLDYSYDSSRHTLLDVIACFRSLGDKLWVAEALVFLAFIEGSQNNFEQAQVYLQESESIFRELGHLAGIADVLNRSGHLAIWQGNFMVARPMLEEALVIQETLGQRSIAENLNMLGLLYFRQEEYLQARAYLERSLSVSHQTGQKMSSYWGLTHLGFVCLRLGELDEAQTIFRKSLQQFQEVDMKNGINYSLEGIASLAVVQKQAQRAVKLLAWTDASREGLGTPRPLVEQASVEKDIATILQMIDEETYATAYATGHAMTMEQAIAFALEETTLC